MSQNVAYNVRITMKDNFLTFFYRSRRNMLVMFPPSTKMFINWVGGSDASSYDLVMKKLKQWTKRTLPGKNYVC